MKTLKIVLIVLITVVVASSTGNAALAPPPQPSSVAYAVYDGDYDYLIFEKKAHEERSIASITKIMTLLVVVELIEDGALDLDAVVTASTTAASRGGTQINLKGGDKFSLEELLYATALVSANDAAVALAEYVAGSEANFTKLMNNKASELGLKHTHYVDCTGLLSIFSNNYSTAYDQAILLKVALQHELFRRIFSTPEYFLKAQDRKISNSHPLLDLPGVEGGKTGATTPAGHTLITSCVRNEKRLIIVVLGAKNREIRNEENKELLEWAFGNLRTLISNEEPLTSVLIPDGVNHQVNAILPNGFSLVALNEQDLEYEAEINISPKLKAPVEQGEKVGEVVFKRADKELVTLDLVAQQGTGLGTWLRRVFNRLILLFKRNGR